MTRNGFVALFDDGRFMRHLRGSITLTSIVSTTGLGHAYGDIVALHNIDLDVPAGSVGLVGANGAGKTTLIKLLLGILQPTVRRDQCAGADPSPGHRSMSARGSATLPEQTCLPLAQTAADFIVYAAKLAGNPVRRGAAARV